MEPTSATVYTDNDAMEADRRRQDVETCRSPTFAASVHLQLRAVACDRDDEVDSKVEDKHWTSILHGASKVLCKMPIETLPLRQRASDYHAFGRAHKMIDAVIHSEEKDSNFGAFRFETLPVPGDHIRVGDIRGAAGVLVVLYVEHHPLMLPVPAAAKQDPSVSLCARFIQELSEDDFGQGN